MFLKTRPRAVYYVPYCIQIVVVLNDAREKGRPTTIDASVLRPKYLFSSRMAHLGNSEKDPNDETQSRRSFITTTISSNGTTATSNAATHRISHKIERQEQFKVGVHS